MSPRVMFVVFPRVQKLDSYPFGDLLRLRVVTGSAAGGRREQAESREERCHSNEREIFRDHAERLEPARRLCREDCSGPRPVASERFGTQEGRERWRLKSASRR